MVGTLRSLLVLTLGGALAAVAVPPAAAGPTQTYIVVLAPGPSSARAEAASLARQYGGDVGFVYDAALRGFSITASAGAAAGLARNPRVSYVEADQPVALEAQQTPTGLGRIFASPAGTPTATNATAGYNAGLDIDGVDDYRVDVDVAVIDTGIDLDNPDLDVVGGTNCVNVGSAGSCTGSGDDDHYHGTHVAGTIAALDNGSGVVGVAPGARLWAVKVLNQRGSGSWSGVIAGIDWVAARGDIEVANLSLGGGFSQAVNDAVAGAVGAGVTMVVAAGNDSANVAGYSPASEPKAITVSALADGDGRPGGLKDPTCYPDKDDTFAGFSNYGAGVDLIAPGVCITSTNNNSTTLRTISGTSMATPHVTGAAALLRSMGKSVATTESDLKSSGNVSWSAGDDPDGTKEKLLDVHDTTVFAPAMVAGPEGGGGGGGTTNQAPTAAFTSSCLDLSCSFDGAGSTDPDGMVTSYSWTFGDGGTGTGVTPSHTYTSGGTYTVTLTVTDNSGATDSSTRSVTVSAPTSGLSFSGSSSQGPKGAWNATVTVSGGVSGTTYAGTWSGPGTGSGSCIAGTSGTCVITRTGIAKKTASVTWSYNGTPSAVVTIAKP
ncbi:MAG: S8 family serine peptidase [Nocardioides sp.]